VEFEQPTSATANPQRRPVAHAARLNALILHQRRISPRRPHRDVAELGVDRTDLLIEDVATCIPTPRPTEIGEGVGQVVVHPGPVASRGIGPHRPFQLDQFRNFVVVGSWRRRGRDPQPIAVGIDELHFSRPRLFVNGDAELGRNLVDVVDPDVHESMRSGVAGMLGQVDLRAIAPNAGIDGQVRLEPMLEGELESEPPIPLERMCCVTDAQHRDHVRGHRATSCATNW
jgi:hypothetical protein